jgi:hypothetical protein
MLKNRQGDFEIGKDEFGGQRIGAHRNRDSIRLQFLPGGDEVRA